jgi:uncharacterized protein YraI
VTNRFSRVIFTVLILLYTGCKSSTREETISTLTPLVSLSTASATLTPVPSKTVTPLAAQLTPTPAPVEGITSAQVNVRAQPSTAGDILGVIPANTKVEITGKDPGESWWEINYAQGVNGKGWVTAQYVSTTSRPDLPMIGGNKEDATHGNVAIVQQQINVRSGPGTDFSSLGTLNPQDVVGLLGKDANGVWLQIDFPAGAGPEGKGWINAAFVQAQGVENLPIITETGLIVGTETPTGIPFTPTPTVIPAWNDQDSSSRPVARVIFEPTGTQTLIYHGDLSSPEGDAEDWIAFRTYDPFVFVRLTCYGSNSVELKLLENVLPVAAYIKCNDPIHQVSVKPDSDYVIHLRAIPSTGNLQYTNYILTIQTRPS